MRILDYRATYYFCDDCEVRSNCQCFYYASNQHRKNETHKQTHAKKKSKEKSKICIESEMFMLPVLLVEEHSIPSEIYYTVYEIRNHCYRIQPKTYFIVWSKWFHPFFKGKNERKKKDDADKLKQKRLLMIWWADSLCWNNNHKTHLENFWFSLFGRPF